MNYNTKCEVPVEEINPAMVSVKNQLRSTIGSLEDVAIAIRDRVQKIDGVSPGLAAGDKQAEPSCLFEEMCLINNRAEALYKELYDIASRLRTQVG